MPTYAYEHKNKNNVWINRVKVVQRNGMVRWYTEKTPERLLANYVKDLKKEYSQADNGMGFEEKYNEGLFDVVNEKHVYIETSRGHGKQWVRLNDYKIRLACESFRSPFSDYVEATSPETLLYWALEYEMPETVKELIQIGANVSAEQYTGTNETINDHLCNAEQIRSRYLKRHPGVPKLWRESWKKLDWKNASDEELCQQVDQLLANGGDVYVRPKAGWCTAFHVAAFYGRTKTLEKLAEAGADTDALWMLKGMELSALYCAAQNGHTETAKRIIELNDEHGHDWLCDYSDALIVAVKNDHMETAQKIVEMALKSKYAKEYAEDIESSLLLKINEEPEMVLKLAECGVDIRNIKDEYGRNLLHLAAKEGNTELTEKLVNDFGFDKDARDNDGQTPMHWAALFGHSETAKKLIDLGADVTAKCNDLREPLYYASANCTEETVEKMIEAGAHCDTRTKNGWRSLNPGRVNAIRKMMAITNQYQRS